jgi:hypothetical protein
MLTSITIRGEQVRPPDPTRRPGPPPSDSLGAPTDAAMRRATEYAYQLAMALDNQLWVIEYLAAGRLCDADLGHGYSARADHVRSDARDLHLTTGHLRDALRRLDKAAGARTRWGLPASGRPAVTR